MKRIVDIPDEVLESKRYCQYFGAWSTKLTELIEQSEPYDEADEWVSVKDKLPEEYGNYLVVTDNGEIDIGTYHPRYIVPQWSLCDAGGFFWVEDKDIEIVKWRPLPKI